MTQQFEDSWAGFATATPLPRRGQAEILESLRELDSRLGEFSDEFVIIGGANLVLRGMRGNAPDVDLLVSDGAFQTMQQFDGAQLKPPPRMALRNGATNQSVWLDTDWTSAPIGATTEMGDGYFPQSYAAYDEQELERLFGYRACSLDDVWGSKAAIQRPKDQVDLAIIANATGRSLLLPTPTYIGPLSDS